MLEVENLSVSYRGISALEAISLSLMPGELVGLIGPNGAGKSTLIKAILGLAPCQGQVLFNGIPLRRQRRRVTYVPQRSQIDWDYPVTVWNVVMMAQTKSLGWGRRPGNEAKRLTSAALDRVDMLTLKDRPIGQLSGGQQQRVFLARALAQQAELFLLDEPFTGIDKKTEAIMVDIFAELSAQQKTLLVCSHEWGDNLNRYDRLLLLNRKLLADDRPQAVMTMDNIQRAFGSNMPSRFTQPRTMRLVS
ncbi:metal ABC transporter ATP-binding protein [Leptothoe spongobia]|uniref:ABC transporter ATP-binding protein n=1 Tax=Leptothoe spongobia TAU-MAC 1115 TaxID=1967444 RepID=A0A947GH93_9CYAN|nr:ABC transporter ATP-binding protein [Leptothoe spongobia]MBT9314814.1 ABC transporter ATP-binding protein [Leptothoe spongobia TAU-MAC 1115]